MVKIDEVLEKEPIEEFEDIEYDNFPKNHIYELMDFLVNQI